MRGSMGNRLARMDTPSRDDRAEMYSRAARRLRVLRPTQALVSGLNVVGIFYSIWAFSWARHDNRWVHEALSFALNVLFGVLLVKLMKARKYGEFQLKHFSKEVGRE